jgi:hypothetical protein
LLRTLGDALVTILAVWLALTLAGLSMVLLRPSTLVAALLSLAVYSGLLALYTFRAGPGRRSGLPPYLLGALLHPVVIVAIVLVLPRGAQDSGFDWVQAVSAGLGIGFQPAGGPDTPGAYFLLPWALNLLLPVVLVTALRGSARHDRAA